MNMYDSELFPYIEGDMLDGKEKSVTITKMITKKLPSGKGKEEVKYILYFKEIKQGLVLNKTNCKKIIKHYGKLSEHWPGKRITLYSERVKAYGEWHDAVRLKIAGNGGATKASKPIKAQPATKKKDAPAKPPVFNDDGTEVLPPKKPENGNGKKSEDPMTQFWLYVNASKIEKQVAIDALQIYDNDPVRARAYFQKEEGPPDEAMVAFWQFQKSNAIDQQIANDLFKESGGDYEKALDLMIQWWQDKDNIPPDESAMASESLFPMDNPDQTYGNESS